jgi:monothiol glutaredoxin
MSNIQEKIQHDIQENDVIVYMKGSANVPQCGFSAVVVQIFNTLNILFKDVNVLLDPDIRHGIKDYSNWPTIPQVYIKGEFIGGCDIVREMYQTGELQTLLTEKKILKPE